MYEFHQQYSSIPRLWFMTSRANDERLLKAMRRMRRMRRRSGWVFRLYDLPEQQRLILARRWHQGLRARRRPLLYGVQGRGGRLPLCSFSDGLHLPSRTLDSPALSRWGLVHYGCQRGSRIISAAVHDEKEWIKACKWRVSLVFLSPIYETGNKKPLHAITRGRIISRRQPHHPLIIALGGVRLHSILPHKKKWDGIAMQKGFQDS